MHTELVEKKKWISEGRFLHALNYCMLLPGPEAQQLATYIGWLLHRTLGGVTADFSEASGSETDFSSSAAKRR
jgi:chromate transporter